MVDTLLSNKLTFEFTCPKEVQLLLYAATGGDTNVLPLDEQEDLEILLTCLHEYSLTLP